MRATIVFSVACAIVSGLTACSAVSPEPSPVSAVLPDPDRGSYRLPLDDYQMMSSTVSAYAESLIDKDCMADKGFSFEIPDVEEISPVVPATENRVGRRLFSPDIAKGFGYHIDDAPDPLLDGLEVADSKPLHEGGEEQLVSCAAERFNELPEITPLAQIVTSHYGPMAWGVAVQDSEVLKSAEDWRACMEGSDLPGVPSTPLDMPTDSMMVQFSTAEPSEEEIYVAVYDAECRENSGFSRAIYEAEWNAQVDVLAAHFDELTRAKDMNSAYEDALLQAVRERSS